MTRRDMRLLREAARLVEADYLRAEPEGAAVQGVAKRPGRPVKRRGAAFLTKTSVRSRPGGRRAALRDEFVAWLEGRLAEKDARLLLDLLQEFKDTCARTTD